jgi:hypothetical protein
MFKSECNPVRSYQSLTHEFVGQTAVPFEASNNAYSFLKRTTILKIISMLMILKNEHTFARQFTHVFCVFKRLKHYTVSCLETTSTLVFNKNCHFANNKSSSKMEHYEQKKYACKSCPTKIVFHFNWASAEHSIVYFM